MILPQGRIVPIFFQDKIAQPSRPVKDKRLRRACGILDRPRRPCRQAPKRWFHHLRQSGIDHDSTGGGESIAAKQSRTLP